MTPFMSMKRKCFRNIFVFAVFCFILLCFVLPSRSYAQTGSEEYYQQMDIQVKNSSAAAQDCAKEEKKRYENAVNWFPKIRNKDSFAYYSCQPMHSAQETPPKQCCDTYYATRNKPGMGDEAWYVLQECGWREETKKRKEAYYKKAEMCLQKDPSVKVQTKKETETFLFDSVRRVIEAKPPLQKAIQDIRGKDAFLVVRDNSGSFYIINNKGKKMNFPESLNDKLAFSDTLATLPALLPANAPDMCEVLYHRTCADVKERESNFEDAFKNHLQTFFPDGSKVARAYLAASYFSSEEFWAGSIEALCKAIAKDGYRIALQKPDNSIERLNELLQIPNFYTIWQEKAKSVTLDHEAEKLIYETASYRKKNFSQLSESEAKNIVKLNRLILEATYPEICPKSLIKFKKRKLSESDYAKIKENFYESYVLGISVHYSSEHSSIRGTINGGGDFIKNFDKHTWLAFFDEKDGTTATDFVKYPIILASASSPSTEHVFILTPSAQVTLSGKAIVDLGYNGETGLFVLEGSAKVKETVTGSEREVPQGSVIYVIPGLGVSRIISASEIKINRWWEGRQKTVKPDSQAISTSLSGTWTMEDSINKMAGSLSLTQTGSNVKGVASLNRGTVRVEGEIAGNEVQLIFIHDNVSGLTNFTQEEVARQIVGITSKATMRLGGDVNKIEGTFYGWQVINDNSLLVTNRYEGGSSEAMRINPPRTFRLVRKGEGTSITLRPGEVWTGSIPAARTLELQARISYPMVAGGAFALEVQVNGQTISTPLLNKERQFRFADGRTFSYYDQGKQSWLIFYSPDFTTNDTGKAGGYQVLTDPGQAYRYVWDISSLMGNAAEFNLKIRHSLTGINNPIEVRINWK